MSGDIGVFGLALEEGEEGVRLGGLGFATKTRYALLQRLRDAQTGQYAVFAATRIKQSGVPRLRDK